jgi:hypothetical protein
MLVRGNYAPGTIVLVFNSTLLMQHGRKGEIRWLGPYRVRRQNIRGSYELNELDGTPMNGLYAGNRLKRYYPRGYITKATGHETASHNETNSSANATMNVRAVIVDDNDSIDAIRPINVWWKSPVSKGPENLLKTYQWPPPGFTDDWRYWDDKVLKWKERNLRNELLESSPQI